MTTNKGQITQRLCLALLLLVCTIPGAAQSKKSNTLPELAKMFLGDWQGTGETPDGESFVSTLNFRWTLDNNFIEVKNYIQNDSREKHLFAATTYGWQPVLSQIVFWSFDRDGTIHEGAAELDGAQLKHEWRAFSKGGEIQDWRSILTRQDDSHVTFKVIDNHGVELVEIKYQRKKK